MRSTLPFLAASSLEMGRSVGRWLGPVRLAVEVVIGLSEQSQPRVRAFLLNPGLTANGLLYRGREWALAWSAAYELLLASIRESPEGGPTFSRQAASGGPRVGLQLLGIAPWANSAPWWQARASWGVEVFGSAAGLAPHGPVDPLGSRAGYVVLRGHTAAA